MTFSLPDELLGARLAAHDRDDDADDERMQIESAVGPLSEAGRVFDCVFMVVECVAAPASVVLKSAKTVSTHRIRTSRVACGYR